MILPVLTRSSGLAARFAAPGLATGARLPGRGLPATGSLLGRPGLLAGPGECARGVLAYRRWILGRSRNPLTPGLGLRARAGISAYRRSGGRWPGGTLTTTPSARYLLGFTHPAILPHSAGRR
jgi:hypothetical protein